MRERLKKHAKGKAIFRSRSVKKFRVVQLSALADSLPILSQAHSALTFGLDFQLFRRSIFGK
jgi:hypothetical protein